MRWTAGAAVWQQDHNGGRNRAYLAHTTDGGATWTSQRFAWFPTALDFVDASHGWVGTGGGVWSTTNGGRTWKSHALRAGWAFSSIDFIDASHGWAAGAVSIPSDPNAGSTAAIFATSDGGVTWHRQSLGVDSDQMNTVSFVNANDGWAVGDGSDLGGAGTIVATTDGGVTWTPQSAGTDSTLSGATFVDAEHGWLPEGDSIYATTDGGATWTAHDAGIPVTAVSFADDSYGDAVGPAGAVATTTDGGVTWQVRSSTTPAGGMPNPAPGFLISIRPVTVGLAFPDATHGWAVAGRTILATSDGGLTWASQTTTADLTDVSFPDATDGWAVGASGVADQSPVILHTGDAGQSWQTQHSGTAQAHGFRGFTAVDAINANHAWVTGSSGAIPTAAARPIVGLTTDGGTDWKFVKLGYAHTIADAVSFVDGQRGWAILRAPQRRRGGVGHCAYDRRRAYLEAAVQDEAPDHAARHHLRRQAPRLGGRTIERPFGRLYRTVHAKRRSYLEQAEPLQLIGPGRRAGSVHRTPPRLGRLRTAHLGHSRWRSALAAAASRWRGRCRGLCRSQPRLGDR